jgi:predicted CoA-binding protein
VDLVNVFRRSEHVAAIGQGAREIGAKGLWLQLGVRDEQAAGEAQATGMTVVQDRCLKIEHGRVMR